MMFLLIVTCLVRIMREIMHEWIKESPGVCENGVCRQPLTGTQALHAYDTPSKVFCCRVGAGAVAVGERGVAVVGMAKNAWLTSLAEPLMAEARSHFEAVQQTSRRYAECAYQAGSWPRERRVIVKPVVTAHIGREPKDNPRFLVTNLKTTPQHVYEDIYCARGDVENRLKELNQGLEIDRTSCGCC